MYKKIWLFLLPALFIVAGVSLAGAAEGEAKMKLKSPEFEHNGTIPKKFTCEGNDISPALSIEGMPEKAQSLALIVDDPDAPMGTWIHWVVFDIPPAAEIKENTIPGKQGSNDFGRNNYGGPCPPTGTHRYFFKLYALDAKLNLKEGVSSRDLEKAMEGHVLDKAELIGLYKRVVLR
jgi:hypothetical protein